MPRPGGESLGCEPIAARTRVIRAAVAPLAFNCVTVTVVRDGSAVLVSEFGQKPVNAGDVIMLGANTLCGGDPSGHISITTVYADTDYVMDQFYWQHAGVFRDRLDARQFAATVYTEPAQILRVGEDRVESMIPWLDEIVALSGQGRAIDSFHRVQALWCSIAHIITPHIRTSSTRTSSTQRAASQWILRQRRGWFAPMRAEARIAANMLRADLARRWSVTDLADEVHLSKSQIGRVFVEAYGKAPIAYLTMLRAEQMAHLLRTTEASIASIAREVGWHDPDFAARQFRRAVGVNPSRYRASRQGHGTRTKS